MMMTAADEAFELGRQHQEDDDDGKAEGQRHAVGLVQRRCLGKRQDSRCRRQQRLGDLLDFLQRIAEREVVGLRPEVIATERCCCSRDSDGAPRVRSAWRWSTSARSLPSPFSGRCFPDRSDR
jgi:hypothetical protein